ncbi:MAG: NUDIX hydrolase [Endozoicomonas sp.]
MSLNTALISVDLVAFQLIDGQLQVLTRSQEMSPGKTVLTLPAGRIEPDTDSCLDGTARRQLSYLTDNPASYLEQVVTIGDPKRDSRGWSLTVVYYALLENNPKQQLSSDAHWVNLSAGQPEEELAYDHNKLVLRAMERLKSKVQYSSLPVYLLPEEFTLSDIRNVIQGILEKAPPMRSIRNRFLKGDLLEETGLQRRGSNRPAALYRLNKTSKTWLFDRLYVTTQQ